MEHLINRRTGEVLVDKCVLAIVKAKQHKQINRTQINHLISNYAISHETELDDLLGHIRNGNIAVNERR